MTPQKHKNGSSGAALMPPRHQTHADSLPEHTSAAASTPVGVLQYLHGKTPVPPRWYWSFPIRCFFRYSRVTCSEQAVMSISHTFPHVLQVFSTENLEGNDKSRIFADGNHSRQKASPFARLGLPGDAFPLVLCSFWGRMH